MGVAGQEGGHVWPVWPTWAAGWLKNRCITSRTCRPSDAPPDRPVGMRMPGLSQKNQRDVRCGASRTENGAQAPFLFPPEGDERRSCVARRWFGAWSGRASAGWILSADWRGVDQVAEKSPGATLKIEGQSGGIRPWDSFLLCSAGKKTGTRAKPLRHRRLTKSLLHLTYFSLIRGCYQDCFHLYPSRPGSHDSVLPSATFWQSINSLMPCCPSVRRVSISARVNERPSPVP